MGTVSSVRVEARITPEVKALIQMAAGIEGSTITDFISKSAQRAAREVIERNQHLKLSLEDSEAFVNAILNPLEPNDALKSAAIKYQETFSA
jgi:uncharacterized protein (DUF1778 family)